MGDTSMHPRRNWTSRDQKYLEDNAGKVHPSDMADHLQRTESAIRHFAYKNGISLSTGAYTFWTPADEKRLFKYAVECRTTNFVKNKFPGHSESSTANHYRKINRAVRGGSYDMTKIKGAGVRGKHLEHTVRSINVRNNIDEDALYSLHVERSNIYPDNAKPFWKYRVVMVTKGIPITVAQWGTAAQCSDQLKKTKWGAVMIAARGVTR